METLGVHPSCAPARRQRTFPRSAERNSLLRFSEKLSARQGRTRLRQFACPGQPVQKRSRSERMNRAQFVPSAQPVLRKRQLLSGKKERQKKTSAFLYKNILDIL